jgi:hypothetical protein
MVNEELATYLREGVNQGISLPQLKANLLKSGWAESEVDDAIDKVVRGKRGNLFNFHMSSGQFMMFFLVFILIAAIVVLFALNQHTAVVKKSDVTAGTSFSLARKPVQVQLEGKDATFVYGSTNGDTAKVSINQKSYSFNVSDEKEIDMNDDGVNDISVKLEKIKGSVPVFFVKEISNSTEIILNKTNNSFTFDCGNFNMSSNDSNQSSILCLEKYAKTCSPAKLSYVSEASIFGIITKSNSILEIVGKNESNCLFDMSVVNMSYHYSNASIKEALSNGVTLDEIKQSEKEMNSNSTEFNFVNKCYASLNDVNLLVGELKKGFSEGNTNCSLKQDGSTVCNNTFGDAKFTCVAS